MFHVYVLQSESNRKIYIGQTKNLKERLRQHNDPSYKDTLYTKRNKGPWKLIYHEKHETRAKAMKREKQLKSARGRVWIKENFADNSC